uniref:Oligopeptidase A N-terminal domain-containing protein n=1 Tax=Triticum aestivum TaxID=4565 RepID=A0A077RWX8_WHEAT|nr:unnamed protein product [Triticum aestivum]
MSSPCTSVSFVRPLEGELEELEKGVEPAWECLVHPLKRIIDRLDIVWNVVDHIKVVKDSPDLHATVEDVQPWMQMDVMILLCAEVTTGYPYSYKMPSCCSCKYRRAYHRPIGTITKQKRALATSYDKKNRRRYLFASEIA